MRILKCTLCDCPIYESDPLPTSIAWRPKGAVNYEHHGVDVGWNSKPWAGEYWLEDIVVRMAHLQKPDCPPSPTHPEQEAMKKLLKQLGIADA